MAKKTQKKKLDNESRHFGVLLEHMDSKFDLVLEGHKVLDRKIDNLQKDVDERFNAVDYKFEVVFGELRLIRNELKEKVSRDEFLTLEKRVIFIEKKLASRR